MDNEYRPYAKRKQTTKDKEITGIRVIGKINKGYFVLHDLFKNGGKIEIATK